MTLGTLSVSIQEYPAPPRRVDLLGTRGSGLDTQVSQKGLLWYVYDSGLPTPRRPVCYPSLLRRSSYPPHFRNYPHDYSSGLRPGVSWVLRSGDPDLQ